MQHWHVYLIRTRDGSLYTGIATDVARRFEEHLTSRGKGARYLRGRAPLELVFHKRIGSRALALRAERRIKRLHKREKERIVRTNPGRRTLMRSLDIETGTA